MMAQDVSPLPSDLHAEAAVLAACLLQETTAAARPHLQVQHLFGDHHRIIYEAMLELEIAHGRFDVLTVRGLLEDRGELQRVGGAKALVELLNEVPSISNVQEYCTRIQEKWAIRQAITISKRVSAEGYTATDSAEFIANIKRQFEDLSTSQRSRFNKSTTANIFEPLTPINWSCKDLCIGPGRPTLIAGYGFSGKTLCSQDMAFSVAAGERIWGKFFAQQGSVLHLDYEQGEHATFRRYQRLRYARGITADQLGDRLSVSCFPRFYLTDPDAEDVLLEECKGLRLVLIDSLKAACKGIEENSSEIRAYLDILTRVSEQTGTAFVVIHHAGKGSPDRDKRESVRGSSAIFDACGTVLKLSTSAAYAPIKVEIAKVSASASGKKEDSFHLLIEDVPDDDALDMQAGLQLVYQTDEQVCPPESPDAARRAISARILEALRREPGLSGREIGQLARIRRADVGPTLDYLVRTQQVERASRIGRGGGERWQVITQPDPDDLP
jgi:hypothetical protein